MTTPPTRSSSAGSDRLPTSPAAVMTSMAATTTRSWTTRMAREIRPESVSSSRLSPSSFTDTIVEEKVRAIATYIALTVGSPRPIAMAKPMSAVNTTWPRPAASATVPSRRRTRTSSFSPTTNSSSDVPTVARSSISEVGSTRPSRAGPTAIPAAMKPTISGWRRSMARPPAPTQAASTSAICSNTPTSTLRLHDGRSGFPPPCGQGAGSVGGVSGTRLRSSQRMAGRAVRPWMSNEVRITTAVSAHREVASARSIRLTPYAR